MLNNFIVFGVPRCGSTYIIQLLEDYLIKKYNLIKSNEHEFFNIFKNIPNNLYIKNSIIKLHTWGTYNNIIEYNLINNISVAITRKNKIDMFVSWLIANETGQWSLHENEQKILPNKKIHLSKEKHGRDSITKYVNSIVRFEYFLKKYKLPIIRYENIFEDIKKLFPDWKLNLKIKYEEERIKKI